MSQLVSNLQFKIFSSDYRKILTFLTLMLDLKLTSTIIEISHQPHTVTVSLKKNPADVSTSIIIDLIEVVAFITHSAQFNLPECVRFKEKEQRWDAFVLMQRNEVLHLSGKMFQRMPVPELDATNTSQHLIDQFQFGYLTYWTNGNHLIWIFRCVIGEFLLVLID